MHRLAPASLRTALLLAVFSFGTLPHAFALGGLRYVATSFVPGAFPLVQDQAAAIYVDDSDYPGVLRAANDLAADVARVTNRMPRVIAGDAPLAGNIIIVGTAGKSRLLDRLIREGKLDVGPIAGKWESFLIQVIPQPLPGVSKALVIAGSDKRGSIFGIYDLSEQIGVSPWYWWADVPVQPHNALFVKPGNYVVGPPAVKYRGIFLNDEAPSLTGWVNEKFGTYNHRFYEKVFELLLRLKANYLWPAMWNNAFNEDDPLNPRLADQYGIVMGTSHHEPMLRAQQEWKRHGSGPWDYAKNADVLRAFWTEGIERNKSYESIVTIGMRGDGDMPMAQSVAGSVALLEKIVADQRSIIARHMNPDLTAVPQLWALYKEVQEYYERGMRVPDDVTLLWSDDNWGNLRRLPTPEERQRSGGAGIYYHFDYVGGPRNYKWLNTVPITKVWEQMNLAWQYGANRIWIVNVGDLKPMEFPIEYFLHLAWKPAAWPKERIGEYTRLWAEREFGPTYAAAIAGIVSRYTRFNGRRKPELLDPDTYSLVDYQEADRVVAEWEAIVSQAEQISSKLPENMRDAFFQLVLYPTKASAQVTELYIAAAKNRLYAEQGRAAANDFAAETRRLFDADRDLAAYYNHTMANGKWDHMMDQTHIGYTYWQEPPQNNMPAVREIELPSRAEMGVAVEGSPSAWPGAAGDPVLPTIDAFERPRRYIDVFNCGAQPFDFSASSDAPWIVLSATHGTVAREQRLWVDVDWDKAPQGSARASVKVSRSGADPVIVRADLFNPRELTRDALRGFVETNGYVSIEAEHYTAKTEANGVRWDKIGDYGRTLSSMAVFPFTAASAAVPESSPRLEYRMYLFHPGKAEVEAILAPTLNFVPGRGLRFAMAFDSQPPRIVDALAANSLKDWETTVKDSVRKVKSTYQIEQSGYHTLKIRMVDPGLVLQKIVVDLGGVKPSYLGPPESYRNTIQ
jgi:hypothetical protein